MNSSEYMACADEHLLKVYNRFQVVFDHGEGTHLYDLDGKKYLDFASGIGVMALGYGNKAYEDALCEQIKKITHTSNLYYHVPMIEAAKKATEASGMSKVFFTNSGAEAIEGAIKTAKKYAYNRDGFAGHEIIAMDHSFHGRTVGAVSITGTEHYREPFYPLMDGVKFADFNDIESVKAQITDKTCAIILETVQGEGGLYPADEAFVKEVRKICDEKDILMICDEIQCGMGRTGYLYAYMHYGITPDIVTTAKAFGNGVPVGAFMVSDKVSKSSLVPGDHGTTYGGNPFVCAAVSKVFDLFDELKLVEHVKETTPYLEQKLDELVAKYDFITTRRGMGFMQGLVLTVPVGDVVKAALNSGVVVLSAGKDVLRLLPPLVVTKEEIDEFISIITPVFDQFA